MPIDGGGSNPVERSVLCCQDPLPELRNRALIEIEITLSLRDAKYVGIVGFGGTRARVPDLNSVGVADYENPQKSISWDLNGIETATLQQIRSNPANAKSDLEDVMVYSDHYCDIPLVDMGAGGEYATRLMEQTLEGSSLRPFSE